MTIEFVEQGTGVRLDVWDSSYAIPREDEHVSIREPTGDVFHGRVTNVGWVGGARNGGRGLERIVVTLVQELPAERRPPLPQVG